MIIEALITGMLRVISINHIDFVVLCDAKAIKSKLYADFLPFANPLYGEFSGNGSHG